MEYLLLLALALGPGLAIGIFIYRYDSHEKEPLKQLVKVFFFGVLLAIPAAIAEKYLHEYFNIVDGMPLMQTAFQAFILVALVEEIAKFFALKIWGYNSKYFSEPLDGIVYGVTAALGFAGIENVMYVFSQPDLQSQINVGILRMFTAVPAHATFGVLMGYYIGKAKGSPNPIKLFIIGILAATLLHGAYDFSLMQSANLNFRLIGALASLIISLYLAKKAMKIHKEKSRIDNLD